MQTVALSLSVVFERREDGGLSASSPEVPGFILSHRDADRVLADVQPALEVILSERLNCKIVVRPLKGLRDALIEDGVMGDEPFALPTHAFEKRQLVVFAA
jgi:hypothetical protein